MVKTHVNLNSIKELSELHLIGNATFTHEIQISEQDLHNNDLNNLKVTETGEQKNYQAFVDSISK
jgi:hypothetical protein